MSLQNVSAHHFSEQELQSLRVVFNQIDSNHDGCLNKTELKDFMTRSGMDTRFIGATYKVFDHNHDEALSFDEFLQYLDACNQTERDPRHLFKLIFQSVDTDHNGELSVDELLEFVQLCGQPMRREDVCQELKKLDIDANGEVNFDELCRAFGI